MSRSTKKLGLLLTPRHIKSTQEAEDNAELNTRSKFRGEDSNIGLSENEAKVGDDDDSNDIYYQEEVSVDDKSDYEINVMNESELEDEARAYLNLIQVVYEEDGYDQTTYKGCSRLL